MASDLVLRIIVSGAYPILFEEGILNLVCGCILRWRSVVRGVVYHLPVTVTLTSELVFRKIMLEAYLLYNLRLESQVCCVHSSWDNGLSHTIPVILFGHF